MHRKDGSGDFSWFVVCFCCLSILSDLMRFRSSLLVSQRRKDIKGVREGDD